MHAPAPKSIAATLTLPAALFEKFLLENLGYSVPVGSVERSIADDGEKLVTFGIVREDGTHLSAPSHPVFKPGVSYDLGRVTDLSVG